jgi:anti-sigma regulatory factor (Ser/Thr protein kinase)
LTASPRRTTAKGGATSDEGVHGGTAPRGAWKAAPGSGAATCRTHDSYRHEAFFWEGDDQFVAGTVPFIREGLEAGQPVMVAVTAPRIDVLREALDGDATSVRFVDMGLLGANPARIIPAWRLFTDQHPGLPVRGIGEPIWHGRRLAELAECQMHEALLNMAVDTDTPLWLMCPYDTASLPADVLAEAHRSHPVVVDVQTHRGSTTYGGVHHLNKMYKARLPQVHLQVVVSHRPFGADDYATVRADVRAHATSAGVPEERTDDLVLAVHEVAVHSVLHGRGASELRIWEEHHSLVCEVRGTGRINDPMVGRLPPAASDEPGRGLWMAHQLCDLVQVRSGKTGTTVRVHTWL